MLLLSIVLASLGPLNCAQAQAPKEPFKIAIATWVGVGPLYIAQEKGYYGDEGMTVEIVKIEDEGARNAAFTAGKVQAAVKTVDTFASSVPNGLPGLAVMEMDESFGGDGLLANKEITDIRMLKGKTVAYPRGMPSHFFLLYLLDKAGLTTQDIVLRDMEAGDVGAAFAAGKVDAAVTWEPWLSQAAKSSHGHVLVTSKETPGLLVDILMITPAIAKTRATDIEKIMRAWFKSLDFVKQHPEEAYGIMGKHLDFKTEDVAAMVQAIRYASYEDNLKYFGLGGGKCVFGEVFNSAETIWKREGVIDHTVTAEEVSSTSFLRDLYR